MELECSALLSRSSGGGTLSGASRGLSPCLESEAEDKHGANGQLRKVEHRSAPGGERTHGKGHDNSGSDANAEHNHGVIALGAVPQFEKYCGDNNRNSNDNSHNIYPVVPNLPETSLLLSKSLIIIKWTLRR